MGRLSSSLAIVVVMSAHADAFSLLRHPAPMTSPRRRPLDDLDRSRRSSSMNRPRHREGGVDDRAPPSSAYHRRAAATPSTVRHASTAGMIVVPVVAGTSSMARRIIMHGVTTFVSNWKSYSLIPLVAGFVGWYVAPVVVRLV